MCKMYTLDWESSGCIWCKFACASVVTNFGRGNLVLGDFDKLLLKLLI